jgi:hypothetical protein
MFGNQSVLNTVMLENVGGELRRRKGVGGGQHFVTWHILTKGPRICQGRMLPITEAVIGSLTANGKTKQKKGFELH